MKIKIYVATYAHDHGNDITVYTSLSDALARQEEIARYYWRDRKDRSAQDDHSSLSDDEVIDAYFTDNGNEFFDIQELELDISSILKP